MDELDDDLFNTLMSSRPKSKTRESISSTRRPNSVERLLQGVDEDDDDGLPDLGLTTSMALGLTGEVNRSANVDVAKSDIRPNHADEVDDFDFGSYVPSSSSSRRPQTTNRITMDRTEADLFPHSPPTSGPSEIREPRPLNREDEAKKPAMNQKESDDWLGIFNSTKETKADTNFVTVKRNPEWLSPESDAESVMRAGKPRNVEQRLQVADSPPKLPTTTSHLVPKYEEHQLEVDADASDLNTTMRNLQKSHARDLEELATSHRRHVEVIEESNTRRESRLRAEITELYEEVARQRRRWSEEREELMNVWNKRLKTTENMHVQDVEKVTDLHREALAEVKRQLARYQTELENVAPFARSLNGLVQQLEKVVVDLGKAASRSLDEKSNMESKISTGALDDNTKLRFEFEHKQQLLRAEMLKLESERAAFEEEKRSMATYKNNERMHGICRSADNSLVESEINMLRNSLEKEREDLREKMAVVRKDSEQVQSLRSQLERRGEELERERCRLDEWARTLRELAAEAERSQRESMAIRQNGVVALHSAKELWAEFSSRSKVLGQREIKLAQDEVRLSKKSGGLEIGDPSMMST